MSLRLPNESPLNETTLMKRWLACALLMTVGSFVVGILAERGVFTNIHESPPGVPDWRLVQAGHSPSLLVAPWDTSTSPFIPLSVLVFVLTMWRLAHVAADRVFEQHTSVIRAKCGNYMLEIVATTLALAWSADAGLFKLLFFPQQVDPPSEEQTLQFARGFNGLVSIAISMYVVELASDAHMRVSLVLHHITAISLTLWGAAVVYDVQDMGVLRAFFAVSLHMTTEQNVFASMLAYRLNSTTWPNALFASAVFYVVTRVGVTALCFWTWSDSISVIWSGDPHSFFSFAFFVFYPFGNFILNATQVQTVGALFGIARSARKKAHDAHKVCESATDVLDNATLKV